MKIIDRLREDSIHISFEVFPPKTQRYIRGGRRHEQKYGKDRFPYQR